MNFKYIFFFVFFWGLNYHILTAQSEYSSGTQDSNKISKGSQNNEDNWLVISLKNYGPLIAAILTVTVIGGINYKSYKSQLSNHKKQSFDTSFFNMLKNQQNILKDMNFANLTGQALIKQMDYEIRTLYRITKWNSFNPMDSQFVIDYPNENKVYDDLFSEKYLLYRKKYEPEFQIDVNAWEYYNFIKNSDQEIIIKEIYRTVFYKYHQQLSYYFRHLYHILNFIYLAEEKEKKELTSQYFQKWNEMSANYKQKPIEEHVTTTAKDIYISYRRYADILQANLSSTELFLAFLNGLNFSNVRALYQHYDFLQNLVIEDLLDPEHAAFYSEYEYEGKQYPKMNFKSIINIFQ